MLEAVQIGDPLFWVSIGKIVWIDLLLSGDNALVIAMACHALPPRQRFWGIILGTSAAIAMRVGFTGVVLTLMTIPYLKIAGGLALGFIAIKLLAPDEEEETNIKQSATLWGAIGTVMVADAVMSLDNVIAVAAAADGIFFLIFGLVLSIPLVIAGASLVMGLLNRFPSIIWAGGALLGWIAGEVIATDPSLPSWAHDLRYVFAGIGAVIAVSGGLIWRTIDNREKVA